LNCRKTKIHIFNAVSGQCDHLPILIDRFGDDPIYLEHTTYHTAFTSIM